MSKSAHLISLLLTAASLAGCMTGRASLLATQGAGSGADAEALSSAGAALPDPRRGLAVSGNAGMGAAALAGRGSAQASGGPPRVVPISARVTASLTAPSPSLGSLKVSAGLGASAGQVGAGGKTAVSITPALAPAAAVGASVAAVSQPLNGAAQGHVGARAGRTAAVKAAVKVKTPLAGVQVHIGR